jgi:3-phosphoshikimate 1-carboxyvinyltransferase
MIIGGSIGVPGDKSIGHRALLLAGLGPGTSRLEGLPPSLDLRSTARALRALGVAVSPLRGGAVTIQGRPRFAAPAAALDCGNSGTTARLLAGLLAAHRFTATLTGDASLRRRPMQRVTDPLRAMGAAVDGDGNGATLPLTIRGGALRPVTWTLPVASAQAKSAILLAAVAGGVEVVVREPAESRDHTERMLCARGFTVSGGAGAVRLAPDGTLRPFALTVPGDFSSAAFLIGAAVLAERGELRITGVGLNPTRTGLLDVLARMGAGVERLISGDADGEPFGELIARPVRLSATTVGSAETPRLIDEVPLLAVLAARAEGTTVIAGAGELRVKESDRLALLVENLRAIGVAAECSGDDLYVTGSDAPLRGLVRTAGDHRIAMAFQVLGTVRDARITLDDDECAAVSYPGFARVLESLGRRRPS